MILLFEPNYPGVFLETLSIFIFLNISEVSNTQSILKCLT